jgi:phosphatidylserine/phosphatidylglycerophosphate/cardiolipin synthase-like enzyme
VNYVGYAADVLTMVGVVLVAWFVLVAFFTPRIDYRVNTPPRLDSDDFLHVVQATCQAAAVPGNRVEILTNGSEFYASMLDAIRAAQTSVNLEAYIFEPGEIAERVIDALVERARAGVEIRVVLDSIGSSRLSGHWPRLCAADSTEAMLVKSSPSDAVRVRSAMMHAEALMVDKTWAVVGSTNIDNRSFEHNDEVNVAFRDPAIAERLLRDFEADLAMSDEITFLDWSARSVVEKLVEPVCWILERQQ